jgi:Ca2+/H+ antiporter, TMEM165/GDT1 family
MASQSSRTQHTRALNGPLCVYPPAISPGPQGAPVDLLWQYTLVFLAAATPWIEILIVIPVAVGAGLAPIPVAAVSFVGNALPVLGIVAAFRWWEAHRGPVRRRWSRRAMRVWTRWGLPGLALVGPLLTGIHLAAIMALALQGKRSAITWWMTASLALWTLGTTSVTVAGIDLWHHHFFGAGQAKPGP